VEDMKSVAVIGAGLGGLSAALILSNEGYDVSVFERNAGPGGKAGNLKMGGFRFDTGPSLMTMPFVLERLFSSVGELLEDHIKLQRLDPVTRYFYPDGTVLDAYSDQERFASEVEDKLEIPSQRFRAYLQRCKAIYDLAGELFLMEDLGKGLLSRRALRGVLNLPSLDLFRTMHDVNVHHFGEERIVQLFDRYATYNGSDPYRLRGIFNMIQHVEHGLGGFAVKGGIYEVPKTLLKLGAERGASFRFGEEVQRIHQASDRVTGLTVEGREERYDAVVSNADVVHTYKDLIGEPGASRARRFSRMEPSLSGSVHYLGIGKEHPDLSVNNIFFSDDYRREFREIFHEGRCPSDPTVYVNITSKVDPSDAPVGAENWFLLVNAPWNNGQDWAKESERVLSTSLDRIGNALGKDVRGSVIAREGIDPAGIENRYLTNRGSIYGISSNAWNSAFLRQRAVCSRPKGLYFAGGSAHPGGGMPLVISSGMIAAGMLIERQK